MLAEAKAPASLWRIAKVHSGPVLAMREWTARRDKTAGPRVTVQLIQDRLCQVVNQPLSIFGRALKVACPPLVMLMMFNHGHERLKIGQCVQASRVVADQGAADLSAP